MAKQPKSILLIIGGGIAAYKTLDLIRRLKEQGASVRTILTSAAREFVTPLSVGALSEQPVFTDLFDLKDETEIGHIRLAREADLIIVAPATADLIARFAGGHANDLASTVVLAATTPILLAPAMNVRMWENAATQRNLARLREDGMHMVGPAEGSMACGEWGLGRMAEVGDILAAALSVLKPDTGALAGRHVLVTAGPTHEPIDPVRYIANRSSGKQGYAIAAAAAEAGARVSLISGPTYLPAPAGVDIHRVETAREMLSAVENSLPADVAIFAAAVADWRVASAPARKLKKSGDGAPRLELVENPDILATIAQRTTGRPELVIGFAAETGNLAKLARAKLSGKGCDWMLANDVSPGSGTFGGDKNRITLLGPWPAQTWPEMTKTDIARRLVERIGETLLAATGQKGAAE